MAFCTSIPPKKVGILRAQLLLFVADSFESLQVFCSWSEDMHYYRVPTQFEPCREKTGFFAYAKTKPQISFAVTAKLISAFVFATRIVQSLYFLNPKLQASGYLLWLYSPVCVGPGRKPRRPVFSERGSFLCKLSKRCGIESKIKLYRNISF